MAKHVICLCSLHTRHKLQIERTFRRKDYNRFRVKIEAPSETEVIARMDSISLACSKIFDFSWRYKADCLLSPRDAEVFFGC